MSPVSVRPKRGKMHRLLLLEEKLRPVSQDHAPESPEDWLEVFRQYDKEGWYRHEPDFPWLCNRFERALRQARDSDNPNLPELKRTHLGMLKMTERVLSGIPPITRAEWERLQAWFLAHHQNIPNHCGTVMLPNGKAVCLSSILSHVKRYDGIIVEYGETVLKQLRLLHSHFATR